MGHCRRVAPDEVDPRTVECSGALRWSPEYYGGMISLCRRATVRRRSPFYVSITGAAPFEWVLYDLQGPEGLRPRELNRGDAESEEMARAGVEAALKPYTAEASRLAYVRPEAPERRPGAKAGWSWP